MAEIIKEIRKEMMITMPLPRCRFNLIMMPWYRGEVSGNDSNSAVAVVHYTSMWHTLYIPYKDPIKGVL